MTARIREEHHLGRKSSGIYPVLVLPLIASLTFGCADGFETDGDGLREQGMYTAQPVTPGVANTTVIKSYPLAPDNRQAFGLAYERSAGPSRLYVSDTQDNKIYVYRAQAGNLVDTGMDINTVQLAKAFIAPRGLAFAKEGNNRFLYALTSNDTNGDGHFANHLWRVDLRTMAADPVNLNASAYEIDGRELFGLAYNSGRVYISYDSSNFATAADQVRRGILRLRVGGAFRWARAKKGDSRAAEKHLPHSGRKVTSANYSRAPSFGLAAASIGSARYLWGTSYHGLLYSADLNSGRGLFYWGSPGKKKIYGLAFGDGYLWAVDRSSTTVQLHQIKMVNDWAVPREGTKRVRHLKMTLTSEAKAKVSSAGVTHNFAKMPPTHRRPHQGYNTKTYSTKTTGKPTVSTRSFDPAGDSSAHQTYTSIRYSHTVAKRGKITSQVELDVWSRPYRHLVYPHLTNSYNLPPLAYTADDSTVYRMTESNAYDAFWAEVKAATRDEYGSAAANSNRAYWRARNIVEYIKEHYTYGNVRDTNAGHHWYNPAAFKLMLPFDTTSGNEKMSCSSSTFALVGVLRYLGIRARWVGTTKSRGGWDSDGNGYLTNGEGATDTSFHRWAEVWMGNVYGWQRFDATPSGSGPREFSQYELMQKITNGVSWKDLVLMAGSGYHAPFYRSDWQSQAYNSVARYHRPSKWKTTTDRAIKWSNACFLNVQSPQQTTLGTSTTTVSWTATGRWDMDAGARLSIFLQEMQAANGGSGYEETGSASKLARNLKPYSGSRTVDLSGAERGKYYRFEIVKEGDTMTGAEGPVFYLQP
jgi:hypothetical protein